MRNARFAEFLLRRTTGQEQAAAQVGDMLELAESRGRFWFWRSMLGTLLRRSWRLVLAVTVAYWVWKVSSNVLISGGGVPQLMHAGYGHRAQFYLALSFIGSTWTMIAAYAAVRFGVRNQIFGIAATLGAVVWVYLWLVWRDDPWAGLAVLPGLAYALFGQRGRWRRAVLGLLAVIPLQVGTIALYMAGFFLVFWATPQMMNPKHAVDFFFFGLTTRLFIIFVPLHCLLWLYRRLSAGLDLLGEEA